MLALIGGWPAIKAWLAKIVRWRVPLVWYGVALLGPPALTLTAVGVNRVLGADFAAGTIAFFWGTFEGPDQLQLWWIWCALWVTATAIIVVANGPALTRRPAMAAA
jgi:hypothetical protein